MVDFCYNISKVKTVYMIPSFDVLIVDNTTNSLPSHLSCVLQEMKKSGGIPAITTNIAKVKLEAEKLEVMDKTAGILAELLYTDNLLAEIKEYRPIMIHVSSRLYSERPPPIGRVSIVLVTLILTAVKA